MFKYECSCGKKFKFLRGGRGIRKHRKPAEFGKKISLKEQAPLQKQILRS